MAASPIGIEALGRPTSRFELAEAEKHSHPDFGPGNQGFALAPPSRPSPRRAEDDQRRASDVAEAQRNNAGMPLQGVFSALRKINFTLLGVGPPTNGRAYQRQRGGMGERTHTRW